MKIAPFVAATALIAFQADAWALNPNCTPGKCIVLITMSAGCGSGIKVAPDPIVVGPRQEVAITWQIKSPGWTFDDAKGILIQNPGKAFEKGAAGGGTEVTIKHKNEKPDVFKYDITLSGDGGKCTLDPTVVNQ
jgi:hypothetical protein